MESQPFIVHTNEGQEKEASLYSASILPILTAFSQGEWEQRVNERELRYLHLLEQRIQVLEHYADAPGKHRFDRPRRVPRPQLVKRVG